MINVKFVTCFLLSLIFYNLSKQTKNLYGTFCSNPQDENVENHSPLLCNIWTTVAFMLLFERSFTMNLCCFSAGRPSMLQEMHMNQEQVPTILLHHFRQSLPHKKSSELQNKATTLKGN